MWEKETHLREHVWASHKGWKRIENVSSLRAGVIGLAHRPTGGQWFQLDACIALCPSTPACWGKHWMQPETDSHSVRWPRQAPPLWGFEATFSPLSLQGQNRCKCLDFSLWFLLLPIEHLNFQDVILTLVPVPGQETKQVRVSAHYDLVVLQGRFRSDKRVWISQCDAASASLDAARWSGWAFRAPGVAFGSLLLVLPFFGRQAPRPDNYEVESHISACLSGSLKVKPPTDGKINQKNGGDWKEGSGAESRSRVERREKKRREDKRREEKTRHEKRREESPHLRAQIFPDMYIHASDHLLVFLTCACRFPSHVHTSAPGNILDHHDFPTHVHTGNLAILTRTHKSGKAPHMHTHDFPSHVHTPSIWSSSHVYTSDVLVGKVWGWGGVGDGGLGRRWKRSSSSQQQRWKRAKWRVVMTAYNGVRWCGVGMERWKICERQSWTRGKSSKHTTSSPKKKERWQRVMGWGGAGWGLRMEAFPEQATTGVGGWGGDGSAQVAAISNDGSVRQAACDEDIIQWKGSDDSV